MADVVGEDKNFLLDLTVSKQMKDIMCEFPEDDEEPTSIPVGLPRYLMGVFDKQES